MLGGDLTSHKENSLEQDRSTSSPGSSSKSGARLQKLKNCEKLCQKFASSVSAFLVYSDIFELRKYDYDTLPDNVVAEIYIEEVKKYINTVLSKEVLNLFGELQYGNVSQVYAEIICILCKKKEFYISGIKMLPIEGSTMEYTAMKLNNYYFGVFFIDMCNLWDDLSEKFFVLKLKDDTDDHEFVREMLDCISKIGLIDETFNIIMEVMQKSIKEKIRHYKNNFNDNCLSHCEIWLENCLKNKWLKGIAQVTMQNDEIFDGSTEKKLRHTLLCEFHDMRTKELFDIIKAFASGEDVINAIEDIKDCTKSIWEKEKIKMTLIGDFKSRLLHSSVGTSGILTYVMVLKITLDIIDPTSYILNSVLAPIKNYLRWRHDVEKTMMRMILDCDGEFDKILGTKTDMDVETIQQFDNWDPEPIYVTANPEEQKADILSFLIRFLESPSKLFNEYRSDICTRLLNKTNWDISVENTELELLTSQFGEHNFFDCRAVLSDISSSSYLDQDFQEEVRKSVIHPIIISYFSWPPLYNMSLNIPEFLEAERSIFNDWYKREKSNKYLVWLDGNGKIELELEFADRLETYCVSELEAYLILYFDGVDEISFNDLLTKIKSYEPSETYVSLKTQINLTPELFSLKVKAALSAWVSRGVLVQNGQIYSVKNVKDDPNDYEDEGLEIEKFSECDSIGDENDISEDIEKYSNAIIGMLKNQGPTTIEKIHSNMTIFLGYSKPLSCLRDIVDSLYTKGLITKNAEGIYYL